MSDATEAGASITLACQVDAGTVRNHNEDAAIAVTLPSGEHLLVVCDGMGGHANGDVASQLALTQIQEAMARPATGSVYQRMLDALAEANQAVVVRGSESGTALMGSTAAIAVVDAAGRRCWAAWVGDSRITVYRGGEELARTRDHSQVAMMVERGIIDDEQARRHSEAGVLLQALGGGPQTQQNFAPEGWPEPRPLLDGDVVLVSSDGLHGAVRAVDVAYTLGGRTGDAAAAALVELANLRSGDDNVAVSLLNVGRPPAAIPEPAPPKPKVDPGVTRGSPAAAAETLVNREPRRARSSLGGLVTGAMALAGLLVAAAGATLWFLRPAPPAPEMAFVGPPYSPTDTSRVPGTTNTEEESVRPRNGRVRPPVDEREAQAPGDERDVREAPQDDATPLDDLLPLEVAPDAGPRDDTGGPDEPNVTDDPDPGHRQDDKAPAPDQPPGELL